MNKPCGSRVTLVATATAFALLIPGTFAHAQSAERCEGLAGLQIAATEIGLPSGGGSVRSAEMQTVSADPTRPGATREFCKILGSIAPVAPNAPPINFQVNLPIQWNGKAVQYGGGGWNGVLITGLNALRDSRLDTPVPVARGFATWGTDSGHEAAGLPEPEVFALDDEAFVNYAYASYKKTRDAARRIAIAFYGRPPSRLYYYGGSAGGREGLVMAQRFPADFDGIVSIVPVIHWTGTNLARHALALVQQQGGWLNPAKAALVGRAVNAACDALDGLADGIVGAYERCLDVFDPATLRCPDRIDAGDACLSDMQIEADRMVHRRFDYAFPLTDGVPAFPGWNYGGETQAGGMVETVTGPQPPEFPIAAGSKPSVGWNYADAFVRYLFVRDAAFNPFQFAARGFAARIREVSALLDSTSPDLSAFLARGGKLILKENGADYQKSPLQGMSYYRSVVARMGQSRVDEFVRFYVTPGVNHAGVGVDSSGAPIPRGVDLLGVLDDWVEKGSAPGTFDQVSQESAPPFKVLSSRPLCHYPMYPHYDGRGDPTLAQSFACARQEALK